MGNAKITENELSTKILNKLNNNLGDGGTANSNAKDISYDDNLTSLGASNVQNAIEKINANIPYSADNISYNDILTQISASNVQEAISKLNEKLKTLDQKYTELNNAINTATTQLHESNTAMEADIGNPL